MSDQPPVLRYPNKARVRTYAVPPRLIVIGWCFVPCWIGCLAVFVLDPGLWDHEPFSWLAAWSFMVGAGSFLGLLLYAAVLAGILLRRKWRPGKPVSSSHGARPS